MCNFCASVTKQNCTLFLSLKYFIFHLWWCPYPNVSLSCILTQNTQQKKKAERRTKGNEAFRTKTKMNDLEIWFSYTFFSDEVWMIQITTFVSLFPSLLLQSYWHSFLLGLNDNLSNPSVTQSLYDLPFTHIYTNGMLNFG